MMSNELNEDEEIVLAILKSKGKKKPLTLTEIADDTLMGSVFDGGFFNLSIGETINTIDSLIKKGFNIIEKDGKYKLLKEVNFDER